MFKVLHSVRRNVSTKINVFVFLCTRLFFLFLGYMFSRKKTAEMLQFVDNLSVCLIQLSWHINVTGGSGFDMLGTTSRATVHIRLEFILGHDCSSTSKGNSFTYFPPKARDTTAPFSSSDWLFLSGSVLIVSVCNFIQFLPGRSSCRLNMRPLK